MPAGQDRSKGDNTRIWESIKEQLRQHGVSTWERTWDLIREQLKQHGVDIEDIGGCEGEAAKVKIVCIAPGLQASVSEVGKSTRDQVVMVRVDDETSHALDAWVESGAVKSRSEAAAVFIREGLKVRASELAQLRDALRAVEDAKKKLRERAREVFGEGG